MQVGWSVRHCPSSYGRQQRRALPTHSSLRPPPTWQVAYFHQRSLKPRIRVSNLWKWLIVLYFSCFVRKCSSVSGSAVVQCLHHFALCVCLCFPISNVVLFWLCCNLFYSDWLMFWSWGFSVLIEQVSELSPRTRTSNQSDQTKLQHSQNKTTLLIGKHKHTHKAKCCAIWP